MEWSGTLALLALSVVKVVTVILGVVVVSHGWRTYRATRRRSLMWLTGGLALVTAGAVAEGAAFNVLGVPLVEARLVEACFTVTGFAVLVASLFMPDRHSGDRLVHAPDATSR